MLNLQIFALTLIPLLSGGLPGGAPALNISALMGTCVQLSREFMVGHWRCVDSFSRWGTTDKRRASVRRFDGAGLMSLNSDGTLTMVDLFEPSEGRWELKDGGLLIFDPRHAERGSQILPVKQRDKDRIWLLLPFSGGATGIGMKRISQEEFLRLAAKSGVKAKRLPIRPPAVARQGADKPKPRHLKGLLEWDGVLGDDYGEASHDRGVP